MAAATGTAPTRLLGFWMCTALVVGNTIGMGIFMLPASLAPFGFNATLGWIVTVFGCVALARVFAQLAKALPEADGAHGYIDASLGPAAAFTAMWTYWISTWVTLPTLATAIVGYATSIVPSLATMPPLLPALVLLWLFTAINLLGARTGGRVQVATTLLKLLPILVVAALGAWLLATEPATLAANRPTVPLRAVDVMAASTLALFAMLGFECATIGAARTIDPARTIPRATMVGTIAVAAIYLTVSTVPMLLIPSAELATANAPFAAVLDRYVAPGAGRWLALFVVVSGLGAMNGWSLLCGEMTRTLASAGTMPRALVRLNARGAPATALVLNAVLASVVLTMSYSDTLVDGFTFLSRVVTAANLPMYLLCPLAWLALRRRGNELARRGWPLAALLGLSFALFAAAGMGLEPFLLVFGLALAGVPVYWAMRRRAPAA